MANYIQFATDDGSNATILVEVDEEEISTSGGTTKISIQTNVKNSIAAVKSTFSTAIKNAIQQNVQGLMTSVRSLPDPPTEVEVSFGLKVTGEVGYIAVAKSNGETNYTIKLTWKQINNSQPNIQH